MNTIFQLKNTYSIYSMLVITSIFFTNCKPKNELEIKKKELAEVLQEQETIKTKVQALQKEIAKLDKSTITRKPKIVDIETVGYAPFEHTINFFGAVEAENNVIVNPPMPGVITKLYVEEGSQVDEGDLIAEVDASVAKQSAYEVKTQIELAKTIYEKQKSLWDQGIGSEVQFLQTKTAYEATQNRLKTIQSQIEMSKIKAPISGTVDEMRVKVGEMAAPGIGVLRLVNNGKMKVKGQVADSYIDKVKAGDKVTVTLPDIDAKIVSEVKRVSKVVNPIKRTFTVEITLPNDKDLSLRPSMYAIMDLVDASYSRVIAVPNNIIQDSQDGKYVLVANPETENFVARKRIIKTGIVGNDRTVIVGGLQAGDQIITFGYQDVVDGQIITTGTK